MKAFGRDLTAGIDEPPRSAPDDDTMEMRFGFLATWTLMRRGFTVDPETRSKLIREVDRVSTDAVW